MISNFSFLGQIKVRFYFLSRAFKHQRLLGKVAVKPCKVVEIFELSVIFEWHHAVAFVLHVLLASIGRLELLRAIKTKFTKLNALCNISQQSFQVDQALNIQNRKVVLYAHVVQIPLNPLAFLVAKQTNSERFKCSRHMGFVLSLFKLLLHLVKLLIKVRFRLLTSFDCKDLFISFMKSEVSCVIDLKIDD